MSNPGQDSTPYVDALLAYAELETGRFQVPGHKGGLGADPAMRELVGEVGLRNDIPSVTEGVDIGPEPTPFQQGQQLAAEAWGAARTWFLTNGASQGNHALCLALAQLGERVVVQRTVHGSTVDGMVLAGLRPTFVAPAWPRRRTRGGRRWSPTRPGARTSTSIRICRRTRSPPAPTSSPPRPTRSSAA